MKKIISLLVITTMIFSMVASLNITTASAASEDIYKFQHFRVSNKGFYTALEGTNYKGKYFQTSGNDQVKEIKFYENGKEGITEEPVLDVISDKYIWNNNSQVKFSKKVLNISFQFYIPHEKYYDDNGKIMPRKFFVSFSKYNSAADSGKTFNNSRYGGYTLKFPADDGYAEASVTSDPVNEYLYNDMFFISPDKWHEVNYKLITNEDSQGTKTLKVGMYVDGTMIALYKSPVKYDVAFDDIGIQQVYFDTTNENKENAAKNAGANPDATTYIKNFKVTQDDSNPEVYSQVFFERITKNDNGGFSIGDRSPTKVSLVTSTSATTSQYYSSSKFKNLEYEIDEGALKVTLTPQVAGKGLYASIQNFRSDITSYFPAGTNYMQMSYDIKIPSDSVSATREQYWRIGNNTHKDYRNTSIYTIGSRIKGGILNFYNDAESYNGDETTRKSVDFTITPDKWYRIITLLKVTNSGTDYVLHAEGYVKDLATDNTYKIYEEDEAFPKLNETDGFVLAQQRTDITTEADAAKKKVVTYYDNILTRFWNEDFSDYYTGIVTDNLPADATDIFNIEVNCHDGKNAVAKARKVEGITNEKLILAAYDANNKLVGIKVSTASDISDEQFTKVGLDISSMGAKKLKAFFFDDIKTCKPLATAPELKVK